VRLPGGGTATDDDRGQLAECLAFISDMALTGDADQGQRADQPTCDDDDLPGQVTGDQVDEETVPEPADLGSTDGGGRARRLRHRLSRLRLQRQRSAPGPGAAAFSTSVDDSVSSHIEMLNSLDSQVHDCALCMYMAMHIHGLGLANPPVEVCGSALNDFVSL